MKKIEPGIIVKTTCRVFLFNTALPVVRRSDKPIFTNPIEDVATKKEQILFVVCTLDDLKIRVPNAVRCFVLSSESTGWSWFHTDDTRDSHFVFENVI